MTRVIGKYIEQNELAKKAKVEVSGDDMREGLCCVLSVKVPEPKFSSQTKDKLVSSEVRAPVEDIVAKALTDYLEEKPNDAKILDRKSTRLNSSHLVISYAVFCLKKKI